MLDYDPELHIEFALQLLEGDVGFLSRRYHVDGYEPEDLRQELRLQLWKRFKHYNYDRAGIRAFANQVMRNRLRDMLRASKRKKRGDWVAFNETEHVVELDLDLLIDICDEYNKEIEDYV